MQMAQFQTTYCCVHHGLLQVVMMGFSMGGYITAAFAATYPELLAGVLLGGCCRDTHSLKWQLPGQLVQAVHALSSYRTKSQVRGGTQHSIARVVNTHA